MIFRYILNKFKIAFDNNKFTRKAPFMVGIPQNQQVKFSKYDYFFRELSELATVKLKRKAG